MQQIDMSREMHMDGRQSAASEVFGCIPHGRGRDGFVAGGKCEEREMANVITCGTFDLFHVGQLRLQRARSVVRKGLLYHGGWPHIICHGIQ